ncbi:MAG: hypothetical protein R6V83_08545 [Candidatus Thorarchaeota archaeon]
MHLDSSWVCGEAECSDSPHVLDDMFHVYHRLGDQIIDLVTNPLGLSNRDDFARRAW